MEIATSLPVFPKDTSKYALTIGNFDGVHLGHQTILKHLKDSARLSSAKSAVLTFSNHPSTIIYPNSPISLLCTNEHKIRLLEDEGIDFLIFIPFTKELALLPAATFLFFIKRAFSFNTLILGNDATLGKNKEGNRASIESSSKNLDFKVEFLADYSIDNTRISSSIIRDYIRQGNFVAAQQMLGRPFSIYAPITKGMGKGSTIGFPTANIMVDQLCLPPLGVYAVTLKHKSNEYYGVANLGRAPTLRNDAKTVFEVHLFDQTLHLYGEYVEIFFNQYIRPEQRFDSVELLKKQINHDVLTAKGIHGL